MARFLAALSPLSNTSKETNMPSTTDIIETNRPLFNRVKAICKLIRPETGARFDAQTEPEAVADRVLKLAISEEAKKVREQKGAILRDKHRLARTETALKRLKRERKEARQDEKMILANIIATKESEAAKLKTSLSDEELVLLKMERGDHPRFVLDRETAENEAELKRKSHGARLLHVAYEIEQQYKLHNGFADMEEELCRDLAEMVLLITALTVDKDAKKWNPRLTQWQDMPWKIINNHERLDDRIWQEAEVPATREPIRALLFGIHSAQWLRMIDEALKVMEAFTPAPKDRIPTIDLIEPTHAVSLTEAAVWFGMNNRTLSKSIKGGIVKAQQISKRKWQFELSDIDERHHKDADPEKYRT